MLPCVTSFIHICPLPLFPLFPLPLPRFSLSLQLFAAWGWKCSRYWKHTNKFAVLVDQSCYRPAPQPAQPVRTKRQEQRKCAKRIARKKGTHHAHAHARTPMMRFNPPLPLSSLNKSMFDVLLTCGLHFLPVSSYYSFMPSLVLCRVCARARVCVGGYFPFFKAVTPSRNMLGDSLNDSDMYGIFLKKEA